MANCGLRLANAKSKKVAQSQKIIEIPLEIKSAITITDKLYSKKETYEVNVNETFVISDNLSAIVTRCIRNQEKQEFVFVKIMRDGNEFFTKWIPVQENAIYPVVDKRYDITFASCNFYDKV